jgi:hypothetical protein
MATMGDGILLIAYFFARLLMEGTTDWGKNMTPIYRCNKCKAEFRFKVKIEYEEFCLFCDSTDVEIKEVPS